MTFYDVKHIVNLNIDKLLLLSLDYLIDTQ